MTKVISLSERAYGILSRLKRKKESFSDVIIRIGEKAEPRPLTDFAGKWAGDDIDEIFETIRVEREAARSREV
jgi:predicted CopG family antitoxin